MTPTAPRGLPPRSCEVCHSRDRLLRCSGCQVTYYCGRDHQTSHWATHKMACNAVKKARDNFNYEEADLRDRPGDFMLPENAFENAVGRFWGIVDTRDYMRARFGLAHNMLENFNKNAAAVESALDHMLGMLRLNHGDNMGLRDIVPALYLRLGRDQEAYDFLRWWAAGAGEGDWDWGSDEENGGQPWRGPGGAGADALEEPTWWTGRGLWLSHAAAATLVKIRILQDLQAMQRAGHAAAPGGVVASRPDVLAAADLGPAVARVKAQVRRLVEAVGRLNVHFWPAMLDPEAMIAKPPVSYSPGTVEEAYFMVMYNYLSWEETPGALDVVEELGRLVDDDE